MTLQRPVVSSSRVLTTQASRPFFLVSRTQQQHHQQCQHSVRALPQRRSLHHSIVPPSPPPPTPFVPDTKTFLTLIGRGLSQHADKIPSWDALFNLTSPQLKQLGVEPARNRKYLLRWREKFRKSEWGVGGDLAVVERGDGGDGAEGDEGSGLGRAVVRLVEVPNDVIASQSGGSSAAVKPSRRPASLLHTPNTTKRIINIPSMSAVLKSSSVALATAEASKAANDAVKEMDGQRIANVHVHASSRVRGSHLEFLKGANGTAGVLRVKEGLWEHKRGQKVDGGERRRADVRAKKRIAQRRAAATA